MNVLLSFNNLFDAEILSVLFWNDGGNGEFLSRGRSSS